MGELFNRWLSGFKEGLQGVGRWLRDFPAEAKRWLTEPGRRVENAFLVLFFLFLTLALGALIVAVTPIWTPFDQDYWFGACERVSRAGRNLGCQDPSERAEIIRNLLFAFAGGTGAIFGLFQLHNSAKRTRIGDDEARISFEAERNDRFVKAAELLRHDNAAIQMAGIVALQRLAQEPKADYRRTVIELLAGFIRAETGPDGVKNKARQERVRTLELRKLQGAVGDDEGEASAPQDDKAATDDDAPVVAEEAPRPSEPVAAAFRALTVLTSDHELTEDEQRAFGQLVDLRGCDLRGLDQPGASCIAWRLNGANLGGANLWGANLWGANLGSANLWDADLRRANLGYANLDFTVGVKTEQLVHALNVTWPRHVPRPTEGPYAEAKDSTDPAAPDPSPTEES
ncbi:MAG: pentapeptide repeat-containing protein [Pseudomonadota bacterium]